MSHTDVESSDGLPQRLTSEIPQTLTCYRVSRSRNQDACPGTLQPHRAADGNLVRVRLPGGHISPAQLRALAHAAAVSGAGTLELTSRGAVQLRGVTDLEAVSTAITDNGLMPSPAHDRIRNILASALSGRSGGLADVRPWVTAVDRALQAGPDLARLPGRFWFTIDDGRGDVSGLRADVGLHAVSADSAALLLAGADTGVRLSISDAVTAAIEIATRFVLTRGNRWRVKELADHSELLAGFAGDAAETSFADSTPPPPVGWIEQDDGLIALGAVVPLGVLSAGTAFAIASTQRPIIITARRSLVIADLNSTAAVKVLQRLVPLGLVFNKQSSWLHVTACAGMPACRHALADVRADAKAAVRSEETIQHPQHFVGCARACGSPPVGEVLVATPTGYHRQVRG